MVQRHNHYEAAFEELLRQERLPYLAVNEARRSLAVDRSLKNADFLVSPGGGECWLIDIKGRRFPAGQRRKQYWKNWTKRDDLLSLAEWARYLGPNLVSLLVFAYEIVGDWAPTPERELWRYGGRRYAFLAIQLADYLQRARPLSARWDTVSLPVAEFRLQARSWQEWLANAGVTSVCRSSGGEIWQKAATKLES